jgi:anion-transporting  ArsA/GET3 family ATPase
MILGTLTFLTGSEFVRNFTDFFTAIDAIAPDIRRTNLQAQQLLLDPSTAFVLISSFDAAKIQEGEAFQQQLREGGYHLRKVIVNRAWPQWSHGSAEQQAAVQQSLRNGPAAALADLHGQLLAYYQARRTRHTGFGEILAIPEMDADVVGLPALERLANRLLDPTHGNL